MAFWGYNFVFDSTPSETYALNISSPEGGMISTTGSGDVELQTQTVFRNPKPYLLGAQQAPVLTFDVQFTSYKELMSEDIRMIQAWLFGQQVYKKLQIVQPDMQDIYFNCFITNPEIIRAGNIIRGIKGTVICDSPWAWEFPRTITKTYSSSIAGETFIINNESDNNYYTYPTVTINSGAYGGDLSITNITDSSRVSTFTSLQAGEVLTVDNERSIIESTTGLRRLSNFNKKWIRLIKGTNTINITGYTSEVKFTYSPARKMA